MQDGERRRKTGRGFKLLNNCRRFWQASQSLGLRESFSFGLLGSESLLSFGQKRYLFYSKNNTFHFKSCIKSLMKRNFQPTSRTRAAMWRPTEEEMHRIISDCQNIHQKSVKIYNYPSFCTVYPQWWVFFFRCDLIVYLFLVTKHRGGVEDY